MPDIDPVTVITDAMNNYSTTLGEFIVDPRDQLNGAPPRDPYGNPIYSGRDPMPPTAHMAFTAASTALRNAVMPANGARARVEEIRGNDLVPKEARHRQVREHLDQVRTAVQDHIRQADTAITILAAALETAALPQVRPGYDQLARTDALMILDRAEQPDRAMQQLARRGDDIGALVTSSWGRDYLLARGIDDPLFHAGVREAGIEAAGQQTGDPVRAGAARYRQRISAVQAARDTVAIGAAALLDDLGG